MQSETPAPRPARGVRKGGSRCRTVDRRPRPQRRIREAKQLPAKEPPGREPQRGSRLPTSRDLLAGQSHPSGHISRGRGSIGGFGFAGKMEYPALGTVQATDSGGLQPYLSSEEPEGREPDGLRFDRERACRLWEAVSAAQPVGREEGE